VWQVAFVELKNVGDFREVVSMLFEIVLKIVERLDICVHAFWLRIGYEDYAIHAAQDQLAAGIVEDLSGNGIEVEASLETANSTQVEWKEVKEESSIGLCGQRDHFAVLLLVGFLKDLLKIRGLPA